MPSLKQHQREIERNFQSWQEKPVLQEIYADFYRRILGLVDRRLPGEIVEVGSGIGNLKSHLPNAITTDLFPNPWLDLVCDGYELPFRTATLSHLILFDVFHHLETPNAFLSEARRVLTAQGRLILFEPYVSWTSLPAYGLFHHEPVAWHRPIASTNQPPARRRYYAAQGNATRLFFNLREPRSLNGWTVFHSEAMASFTYLLSGGFSRPALYPAACRSPLQAVDAWLSRWPSLFGSRCLVGLERNVEV